MANVKLRYLIRLICLSLASRTALPSPRTLALIALNETFKIIDVPEQRWAIGTDPYVLRYLKLAMVKRFSRAMVIGLLTPLVIGMV
jgi:hypothetical protein